VDLTTNNKAVALLLKPRRRGTKQLIHTWMRKVQLEVFFKSNESVQVFAWKKERNCLGTAIEEREGTVWIKLE